MKAYLLTFTPTIALTFLSKLTWGSPLFFTSSQSFETELNFNHIWGLTVTYCDYHFTGKLTFSVSQQCCSASYMIFNNKSWINNKNQITIQGDAANKQSHDNDVASLGASRSTCGKLHFCSKLTSMIRSKARLLHSAIHTHTCMIPVFPYPLST